MASFPDNAIKYTDGSADISVSLVTAMGNAVLDATDNGIGIAETDQQSVFRLFNRCDRSRCKEGWGPGLAFAR